ncbi:MAG: hypothetical protein R2697_07475 [Ilumatobacteraceae bacterium]
MPAREAVRSPPQPGGHRIGTAPLGHVVEVAFDEPGVESSGANVVERQESPQEADVGGDPGQHGVGETAVERLQRLGAVGAPGDDLASMGSKSLPTTVPAATPESTRTPSIAVRDTRRSRHRSGGSRGRPRRTRTSTA